jgi:hypothetical protein
MPTVSTKAKDSEYFMNSAPAQLFQNATKFLIALSTVLSTAFLVACGGGSGQGTGTLPTAQTAQTVIGPAGSCNPTLEQFKAIPTPILNVAQVNTAMGCEGVLEKATDNFANLANQNSVYNNTSYLYRWSSNNGGPSVVLEATKDKNSGATSFLFVSNASFETNQPTNACILNELNIPLAHFGQTIDELNTALGCKGTVYSYSLAANGIVFGKLYWGLNGDYVAFANDKAQSGAFRSAKPCAPDFENWGKLQNGDTLAIVRSKMQCDGYFTYRFDDWSPSGQLWIWWGTEDMVETTSIDKWTTNFARADFGLGLMRSTEYGLALPSIPCLATQESIEKLSLGMSRATVDLKVGCTPDKVRYVSTITSTAHWDNRLPAIETGLFKNRLSASFTNDVLTGVYYYSSSFATSFATSICQPTQSNFDSLEIGDTFATVVQKMGCSGALTHLSVGSNDRDTSTYIWKLAGQNTQRLGSVSFTAGLLTGRGLETF